MIGVIRVDLETLDGNTGGDSGRVSRNNIRRGVVIVDIVEVAEQQWSPCYVHLKTTQIPTLMLNLIIHLSYILNLMTQPDHMRQLQL